MPSGAPRKDTSIPEGLHECPPHAPEGFPMQFVPFGTNTSMPELFSKQNWIGNLGRSEPIEVYRAAMAKSKCQASAARQIKARRSQQRSKLLQRDPLPCSQDFW